MKKITSLLTILMFTGMAGAAQAATILVPTDGDINFVELGDTGGFSVRVFDDAEAVAASGGIAVVGKIVDFDDSLGYTATSGGVVLDLVDSLKFQVGLCDGGSCATETSLSMTGENQWLILYDIGGTTIGVVVIDVNVDDDGVPEVPLPAAAWLFCSALLGLGVVKRKKALA